MTFYYLFQDSKPQLLHQYFNVPLKDFIEFYTGSDYVKIAEILTRVQIAIELLGLVFRMYDPIFQFGDFHPSHPNAQLNIRPGHQ